MNQTPPIFFLFHGTFPFNNKFLLQPHQKYNITQYEQFGFSSLTQMKDDYTTNSLRHLYIFLKRLGECTFDPWSGGVKKHNDESDRILYVVKQQTCKTVLCIGMVS